MFKCRPMHTRKKESIKYREFYESLLSNNQIYTRIDLNTYETKGTVTTSVLDIISVLRRIKNVYKIPKCISKHSICWLKLTFEYL